MRLLSWINERIRRQEELKKEMDWEIPHTVIEIKPLDPKYEEEFRRIEEEMFAPIIASLKEQVEGLKELNRRWE